MTALAGAAADRHRVLEEQVARRLVAEGYDVILEPGLDHLPPDVARFRPDILARRGDEKRVVEIKIRADRSAGAQVEELARVVQAKPGWHFDLVLGSVDTADSDIGVDWTAAEVTSRIEEGEALARDGHLEAALCLLYAAAEAAARDLASREQVDVQRWHPPPMFRQLVHVGLVDRDAIAVLDRAYVARNRVAHGLAADDLGTEGIAALAEVTRAILAEAPAGQADLSDAP
jgi:hypothetical protein